MRLIIYLIIFTLISSKVYANFNLNGAPLAENRINLTPQDFKISIESQKKMKVNIDMSGNYFSYMKLRTGLAELKKAVNTEEETINMDSEHGGGIVKVHLVLSTYRLP